MDFPEALRPGDRVALVAPSSPFPREALLSGLAWLAQRYEVLVRGRAFSRQGFLAGSDDERARELSWAMTERHVRAIFVARGGYGATRIASRLPWTDMRPRWLVGFSDVTALHVSGWAAGLRGLVHAPNVTGLGASSNAFLAQNRAGVLDALEQPAEGRTWRGLRVLREGRAQGPLFGGNLTLLCTMAAAGKLVVPEGAILLLEDVTERPYRIDRMLTALLEGGHLARASAIVFGSFEQCGPGPDGVTVDAVLAERAGALRCPVLAGAPFGHGERNEAFPIGVGGRVEGDAVRWPL